MKRSTVSSVSRYAAGLLLVLLAYFSVFPLACADPDKPKVQDREITKAVARLLRREHLSHRDLDKEISQRCLQLFLKALDPWKVYFYQSDVDGFLKRKDTLDETIRNGDISFAYDVFRRFLERVDERVKTVDELLAAPIDFTVDEEMIADRDEARYPQNPAEARDRWRQRIKYDLLVLKSDKKETDASAANAPKQPSGSPDTRKPAKATVEDPRQKISKRYHSFAKRMHQFNEEDLLEIYLNALTTAFDPHTDYMSPDTYKNFRIAMSLELEGIGASLQSVDGYTVVKKIIPGGAADKDGRLKIEDKIVGVRETPTSEMVDTVDMKLSDVVKMIRGKPGSVVQLEVVSDTAGDRKIIEITRAKIELKDSEAQSAIFEAGQRPDGRPYRIGLIDLPSFYMDMERARLLDPDFKSSTKDIRRILDDFNKKHVDAVILDLRRNGGGSLTEAINVTGLFIDEGPVVQVKDGNGQIRPYNVQGPGAVWRGPLVVLTSKFSASASEILAGAIQDYHRGLIIGDHATHGKGTVQSLMELSELIFRGLVGAPNYGALKITMQQFYRPNGESTQKRGVLADVELPSITTHLDVGEADLDYPVEFDKVPSLTFRQYGEINPTICGQLAQLSASRQSKSEKFQKVLQDIVRYKEQKARKRITLNEEKFLKERAEMNADKEEEKKLEELSDPNQTAIKRDYYLDEALNITVDYLNLRPQVARVR